MNDEQDDSDLDETVEETFPASDAPANTVETGISVGDLPDDQPATNESSSPNAPARRTTTSDQ